MKSPSAAIFLGLFCIVDWASSECPAANDDPIMYNSDYFLCAQFWEGYTSDEAINSCNICPENGYCKFPEIYKKSSRVFFDRCRIAKNARIEKWLDSF